MLDAILSRKVKYHIVVCQVVEDIRSLLCFHLNIRANTTTVTHLTTGSRVEDISQAIRCTSDGTVCIATRIVDSLHTSSARDVVFGSCHLHTAIIRKVAKRLYQALTKSTITDNHRTVKVLQRSRKNFSSRSGTAIHQYSQWNIEVKRLIGCTVSMIHLLDFPLCLDNLHTLRHEEVHHIYGFTQQTAPITTHINHQRSRSLLFQFHKSTLHILGTSFHREGTDVDVTHAIIEHIIIRYRIGADRSTSYLELHGHISAVRCRSFNLDDTERTWVASQIVAYIRSQVIRFTITQRHFLTVNLHNDVARFQACFCSRITFRRFNNGHSLARSIITDHRTNTTELT